MTLSEIIIAGMNNPDCSFFTGAFVGQWLAVKYLIIIWLIYVVFKFIDKLAIEPLTEYVQKRIQQHMKKRGRRG